MEQLHPPINGTEQYLAAVYERLGETNTLLGELLARHPTPAEQEEPNVVELREPLAAPGAVDLAEPGAPPEGRPPEPDTVDLAEPAAPVAKPRSGARTARARTPTKKTEA